MPQAEFGAEGRDLDSGSELEGKANERRGQQIGGGAPNHEASPLSPCAKSALSFITTLVPRTLQRAAQQQISPPRLALPYSLDPSPSNGDRYGLLQRRCRCRSPLHQVSLAFRLPRDGSVVLPMVLSMLMKGSSPTVLFNVGTEEWIYLVYPWEQFRVYLPIVQHIRFRSYHSPFIFCVEWFLLVSEAEIFPSSALNKWM